jgi:hypothetical protein
MILFQRLGGVAGPATRAIAVALFAGFGLAAAPVSAATCHVANVTTDAGLPSLACVANVPGGPGGNVRAQEMNTNSIFGQTGWVDYGKIDLPKAGPGGGAANFLEITFSADRMTGTWKLRDGFSFDPNGHYALALKAGAPGGPPNGPPNGRPNGPPNGPPVVLAANGANTVFNVVYKLDIANGSGTWSTADLLNPGGQRPALSNITMFGTAAPIPLPAAAWLLIGGLAGLSAVARRRKAAAAA